MITLNALYSETGLFDKITFRPGINIIKGLYTGRGDVNGIGKSSVVRLIDYAFLATGAKSFFKQAKFDFVRGHDISLEFSIHDDSYKIKHFFRDKDNKVYFGKTAGELVEYSQNELKKILGMKLFPQDTYKGIIENGWFRNLMRFYIKEDLKHHQRLKPEEFINPGRSYRAARSVYHNLFLLDLPNENIVKFDRLDEDIKKKGNVKKELEKRLQEETGKTVDQYNSEKQKSEERIELLEKGTTDYKFLKNYEEIEEQLVKLSSTISEKLSLLRRLEKESQGYKESYKLEFDADIEKVSRIYSELDQQIGSFAKKTLQEVVRFRRDISENRKKFLKERQQELSGNIERITKEISQLETRRVKLYKYLEEKKALDSLKHSYEMLIEEKATLARNDAFINQINELTLRISETSEKISAAITSIIKDIQGSQEKIRELRALFFEILKNAVMVDENTEGAVFEIRESESRKAPCKIQVDIPKSDSLGKSRFKILAYDLTILLNQVKNQRRVPHFLIHDGVFHSIAPATVKNTLNYMYSQTLSLPAFQYIITANENELDFDDKDEEYRFNLAQCIIAEFEDIPERMLFKRHIP